MRHRQKEGQSGRNKEKALRDPTATRVFSNN
jgi:hypothetical protein